LYPAAARHDAAGEIAALTQAWIDRALPGRGFQGLPAVTGDHRGHRPGLLLKTTMPDWLAQAEPQLNRLQTRNAAADEHMIAVNETPG
jgi:hypothetical protein